MIQIFLTKKVYKSYYEFYLNEAVWENNHKFVVILCHKVNIHILSDRNLYLKSEFMTLL